MGLSNEEVAKRTGMKLSAVEKLNKDAAARAAKPQDRTYLTAGQMSGRTEPDKPSGFGSAHDAAMKQLKKETE